MSIGRRILRAVTPRRVAATLLVGAFAREILAAVGWSASVLLGLADEAAVRGLVGAGIGFALEVALIYLVLRGLGGGLERLRSWPTGGATNRTRDGDRPIDETGSTPDVAASRPPEGGLDGDDVEDR